MPVEVTAALLEIKLRDPFFSYVVRCIVPAYSLFVCNGFGMKLYVMENFPLGMELLERISWSQMRCSPCSTVWQSLGEETTGDIFSLCVKHERYDLLGVK
jgi:hypothetical protein